MSSSDLLVAKTALLVPCLFRDGLEGNCAERAKRFLARTYARKRQGKKATAIWERDDVEAEGLDELDPAFQTLLAGGSETSVWAVQRLRLRSDVRDLVLPAPALVDGKGQVQVALSCYERIELFLFPLSTGMLVLHVDWMAAKEGKPRHLHELSELVAMARRMRAGRSQPRWRFAAAALSEAQRKQLGPELAAALTGEDRAPLVTLTDWMLRGEVEDATSASSATGKYALHQTAVFLDRALERPALERALFHLRRGVSARQPPPSALGTDVTLEPRGNRHLGVCREGIAAVSWAAAGARGDFDRDWAKSRFLRLFLLLAMQAHAERITLGDLEASVAGVATRMGSVDDLGRMRDELFDLARQISRYSLAMASEDCGGLSDYVAYFKALRTVLSTGARLAETRALVAELLGLVEAAHARQHQIESDRAQERESSFHRMVAIIGGIGVVFGIVTGLLGMNLPEGRWAPMQPLFWAITGATLLGALLVVIWAARAARRMPQASKPSR
jgi:hypothetical protein